MKESLAKLIIFTIHAFSSPEIPNTDAILETAQQDIQESAQSYEIADAYIITVNKEADLDEVIDEVQSVTGGIITHTYRDSIKGFAIEVPPEYSEEDLYLHEAIETVEPDVMIKPYEYEEEDEGRSSGDTQASGSAIASAQPSQGWTNGVRRIGLEFSPTAKVDNQDDEMPVNVAIIDTGIDSNHPDLNVVYSENFISSGSGEDDNGHGTHIAGIAAAKDNGIGVVGVAPGARLYSLKVLNQNSWGLLSDIVQAVDWVSKESKPPSSSSNSDYEDYMRDYERAMDRYRRELERANGYRSRVQEYMNEAAEHKQNAELYKNATPPPDDRNVQRIQEYQQEAQEYLKLANQYKNATPPPDDRDVQRVQEYQQEAQEYLELANQYKNATPPPDDRNVQRVQEYQQEAQEYLELANQYKNATPPPDDRNVQRVQRYQQEAQEYLELANLYKNGTPPQDDRDVERMNDYRQRADEHYRQAQEYRNAGDMDNYEREMSRYQSDLERVVRYQERIQRDLQRNYQRAMERHERALERVARYQQRIQDDLQRNYERAMERHQRALERVAQYQERIQRDLQRNYERAMERHQRALERVARYQQRIQDDLNRNYERAMDRHNRALEQVVRYQERLQRDLLRDYERYMTRYERAIERAESYQERVNRYQSRANNYLAEAQNYKRQAEQLRNPSQSGRNPKKIDVVNMSIGAVGRNSALHRAIQESVKLGVTYVVSAGNSRVDIYGNDREFGTSDDQIPAAYPEVVAVSATIDTDMVPGGLGPNNQWGGLDDTFAAFSNFSTVRNPPNNPVNSPGGGIDVAAPGVLIFSTWPGGIYNRLSGTSMAAPHVTGAVALLVTKLGQDVNNDGRLDENDVWALRQLVIDSGEAQSQWRVSGHAKDPDFNKEPMVNVSSF